MSQLFKVNDLGQWLCVPIFRSGLLFSVFYYGHSSRLGQGLTRFIYSSFRSRCVGWCRHQLKFDTIVTEWQQWGEIFEIQTHRCQLYDEIMAESNETP